MSWLLRLYGLNWKLFIFMEVIFYRTAALRLTTKQQWANNVHRRRAVRIAKKWIHNIHFNN